VLPRRAHCHWGNLYYLMGASPLDRVIGETPIIYYVLLHPILRRARFSLKTRLRAQPALTGETSIIYYVLPRRAHCHWGILYYFVCASPSCSSASALPLGKPLLFSGCFPSYRYVRGLAPTLIVVDAKPFLGTLGKPLLFSRCFPIIFPGERIEER